MSAAASMQHFSMCRHCAALCTSAAVGAHITALPMFKVPSRAMHTSREGRRPPQLGDVIDAMIPDEQPASRFQRLQQMWV